MDWINRIRRIQLDITSHCNAKCPGCVRTDDLDRNKYLTLEHFSSKEWYNLCQDDTGFRQFPNLTEIVFNGSFGDPSMHPDLVPMINEFYVHFPHVCINMHTNGGPRTTEWWKKLGETMAPYPHSMIFAIDGLADTHSLYRVATSYERVIENMRAFISGGGSARWMMTIFDHNRHQIDEARHLAKEYGCRRFLTRKSHTKYMNVTLDDSSYEITTDNVVYDDYVDEISASPNQLASIVKIPSMPDLPAVDSQCEWYVEGGIQIDAWGNVWPCCHTAPSAITYDIDIDDKEFYKDEIDFITHNPNLLKHSNVKINSLRDILTSEWWTTTLEDQVESAKLIICKKECGVQCKR